MSVWNTFHTLNIDMISLPFGCFDVKIVSYTLFTHWTTKRTLSCVVIHAKFVWNISNTLGNGMASHLSVYFDEKIVSKNVFTYLTIKWILSCVGYFVLSLCETSSTHLSMKQFLFWVCVLMDFVVKCVKSSHQNTHSEEKLFFKTNTQKRIHIIPKSV